MQSGSTPVTVDQQYAPAMRGEHASKGADQHRLALVRHGGAEHDGFRGISRLGQLQGRMQFAQGLGVGRNWLAHDVLHWPHAILDLRHHRENRQAGRGLDLLAAAERSVESLAQQRPYAGHQSSGNDPKQHDQRLGRKRGGVRHCGTRDELGVGALQLLLADHLLGTPQHLLQQMPIDVGVAFQ